MDAYPSQVMNIQPERLKNLLKEMVNIYSPSGKEEQILKYVEGYLKRNGLASVRQKVDDNRFNLVVFPEGQDEVELCFVGHLDTITAYDLDDYGFYEDGDTIYGLGTADMKAACAAMIEVFITMVKSERPLPSVGLALVVGEEEEGDGARMLTAEYGFPWAVVGEPTGMMPCLGHYGYLEILMRTKGKRAHSSMPELGLNAIEGMLKLLIKVTDYATSSPSKLVYNIRELSGFPSGFVVPDTCEAWLDIHLPPDSRIDILKTEMEQLVEQAGGDLPGLEIYMKFEDTHSGYRISEERTLVKKLKGVYQDMSMPWKPQDFRSHSDANVLWAAGVDPVILGPGRLEESHTPEESISFNQAVQAAQLYLNFALSL